jgi:hypothetical protein
VRAIKAKTRALEQPIRQIAETAGVEGLIVVGKITENKSQTYGFDAQTEQYVDMLSAGIVDPAKVVRVALSCPRFFRPSLSLGRGVRHDGADGHRIRYGLRHAAVQRHRVLAAPRALAGP